MTSMYCDIPYMTYRICSMYGDFPAKNTTCTPCKPINVWLWPTLNVIHAVPGQLRKADGALMPVVTKSVCVRVCVCVCVCVFVCV